MTFTANSKTAYVGGLFGYLDADLETGYSTAKASAYVGSGSNVAGSAARVGGLAGHVGSSGGVSATYAAGAVVADTATKNGGGAPFVAIGGGLVGYLDGNVTTSYARGAVSAKYDAADTSGITGKAYAGGLVGVQDANITASFSTGAPTATGDNTPTAGGLVANRTAGTTTNSYWDTQSSGVSATGQGTGKTTSELQTPTAYGTGSAIYAAWNLNLDGQTDADDPWNFGTASQYPALKYDSHDTASQRNGLTIAVSPTTIWESNAGDSARATSATITATLQRAWNRDVAVTLPADATAYTLNPATLTVPAGSTAATVALTAVNNYKCGTSDCPASKANKTVTLTSATDDVWVPVTTATNPTVTINDDDELTKPAGLKLSVDGLLIRADWTAVTNATGYKVQWSTASDFATLSEGTVSSGDTTNYTINPSTALTANTRYYVRVLPTKTGADEPPSDAADTITRASAGTGDYDADNDGLIEIRNLAQLNAMRWDLNGDGAVDDSANATAYATAFPNAEDNMGCNETAASITSNNTGNEPCDGYELAASLDFDTGTKDDRTDDTYYNSGAGWSPIGDGTTAYTAKFDGNNDSDSNTPSDGGPYTITNLHVNASSTAGISYAGLFGVIGAGGEIGNVALTAVSVTGTTTSEGVYVGALAGKNSGTITGSWSLGAVTANLTGSGLHNDAFAGGLVGLNDLSGIIRATYSRAVVTATAHDGHEAISSGLVAHNLGTIAASYATGDVTANRGTDTAGAADNNAMAGGLVADNRGTITASYATGDTTSVGRNTWTGGLVGHNVGQSPITASYSLGKQNVTAGTGTNFKGGLVGASGNAGTITDSYWDTTTSGESNSAGGTGKTTAELQTPTAYGTGSSIYANWDADVDGVTGNDDPWDFGTNAQYPVLDFTGHVLTKQRATVTITASPTTIWERADTGLSRVNESTITATLSGKWEDDLTIAPPAAVSGLYTLGSAAISIPAGSASGTVKLTSVDDTINQTSPDSRSVSLSNTTVNSKVIAVTVTNATITINDDDNVAKAAGVRLSVDGTKIRADWTAATGATGYKIQWATANTFATKSEATVSGVNTTNYTINPTPALTANTRYYIRVISTRTNEIDAPPSDVKSAATRAAAGTGDYDADNDGLIEITTLAQLNAMRWDLDGDGVGDKHDSNNDGDYTDTGEYDYTTDYATAFPNAEDNMGCNESAVTITSNNTGNPDCSGYELAANLNFDTNGNNVADSGDTYWNGGLGWTPIGDSSNGYDADFEGTGFTISNLFINESSAGSKFMGLFALLGANADVKNVGLANVSVTAVAETGTPARAGALAADNLGTITGSWSTGSVKTETQAAGFSMAGGLVGRNESSGGTSGKIVSSYSKATVAAHSSNTGNSTAQAGGLVGRNKGSISASYAIGDASVGGVTVNNSDITLLNGFAGGWSASTPAP